MGDGRSSKRVMPSVRSGRYSPGPMAGSSSGQNRPFQYSCAAGERQEEPNFLATVSVSLLFRVDGDHRLTASLTAPDLAVDELKLGVTIRMLRSFLHLAVAL